MSTPTLKIKVTPTPKSKGKMDVRFPAMVYASSPILLDKANGAYTISLDVDALSPMLSGDYVARSGDAMTGALHIRASSGIPFDVIGGSGELAQVAATGYNTAPVVHGYAAGGTEATPAALPASRIVLGYGGRAWDGTQWQDHSASAIHHIAKGNQNPTNWGQYIKFWVTPENSTNRSSPMTLTDNSTLWVHDEATGFDETVATQTKPWRTSILASGGSGSGQSVSVAGYGVNAGFRGGKSNGTVAAPTATAIDDFLTFLGGHGYDATSGWSSGSQGLFGIRAAESWTSTAKGTYLTFETSDIGGTTRTERARIYNGLTVGSATGGDKGAGTINVSGNVYVNNVGLASAAFVATGTSGATIPLLNAANTWSTTQTFTVAPVFTNQSGSRTALGLGTAATQNTGTSGANVPLLNGTNTWSAVQTFSGNNVAVTGGAVTISGINVPQLNFISTLGGATAQLYSEGSNWNIASQGVADWFRVNLSTGMVSALRSFATPAPSTKTANYTMTDSDSSLIFNGAGSLTVTLPAAASYSGRWITMKTIAAQTVVSASSNVVPLVGGAAGTAILAATAGKWARLQSDGTNWIIMEGN